VPEDLRELVIVGSGPSGLTAAIYAARANLRPVVIEGVGAGGQLMLTTDVENYPGFPDGILGPELMMKFREQAERFGAEFVTADADRVDLSGSPFGVWVGDREFRSHAVIVSTGATARMLGIPSEQRLLGHGVSTCATCDGFFFRNKDLAIVGGGDSAIEEAIFLTRFATTVTIVHRREELRASKIMQERAFANDKIRFRWNAVVEEVVGDGTVDGVLVRDTITGETSTLPVQGLFVAIGHDPTTRLFRGQSSRPATCRTTCTARPSPPRAPAAWPRSRRSGGSRHVTTLPGRRGRPSPDAPGRNLRSPAMVAPVTTLRHAPHLSAHRHLVPEGDGSFIEKGTPVGKHIVTVSDATFDETIGGADTPVLVDFWAEWCGPCQMIAPTLEEIAAEHEGKLKIAKLNVDENPNTAMRFNVMSIPTLLVFQPGDTSKEARRLVGAKGKAQLLQDLAEFVA
jgi:thioredoxin reductase (NADPH)